MIITCTFIVAITNVCNHCFKGQRDVCVELHWISPLFSLRRTKHYHQVIMLNHFLSICVVYLKSNIFNNILKWCWYILIRNVIKVESLFRYRRVNSAGHYLSLSYSWILGCLSDSTLEDCGSSFNIGMNMSFQLC